MLLSKFVSCSMTIAFLLSCNSAHASPLIRGKSLILYTSADMIEFSDLKTEEERLELYADGRWQRTHKLPHATWGQTTTTTTSGVLDSARVGKLFEDLQRVLRRAQPRSKYVKAKTRRRSTVLALYGFGKKTIFLGQKKKRASPGLEALLSLITALPLKISEPTGAKRRIEQHYHTMVGEGASSKLSFSSKGFFKSAGGGDIGSGYRVGSVVQKAVDDTTTRTIFKKLSQLVRAEGLATRSDTSQPNRFQDQYYSLIGFSPSTIILRDPKVTLKLAAILLPVVKQPPPASNFFARQVTYKAILPVGSHKARNPTKKKRVRAPRTKTVEGQLFVSGHWIERPTEGKKRKRRMSPRIVNKLFGALQLLMDQPPHKHSRSTAPTPAVGVTYVTIYPFDMQEQSRTFSPRDPGFPALKALLERTVLRIR